MFHFKQVFGCIAVVLALALLSAPASAQRKDVKMMLDWVMQGTHAPFFVAQEKGYYKEAGLNVTVVTSARNDAEGKALLAHLGMPFRQ